MTRDLKNQSTRWLLCFSNDGANSMIHDHASFNASCFSCDVLHFLCTNSRHFDGL
jgi:hypothetical protein